MGKWDLQSGSVCLQQPGFVPTFLASKYQTEYSRKSCPCSPHSLLPSSFPTPPPHSPR